MVATKSLLETHDWFGSFQHPHATSQLTGKLTYVPERGLRLEWFVPFDSYDARGEILHGTLEQGLPCTLYGNFEKPNLGFAFNMGTMVNKGQWSPRACVLGLQLDKEDTFDGVDFEINNLQEFL